LANAWKDTVALTRGWGLQIGMDTPQVTSHELDRLLGLLGGSGALLGPALDGGWWVIGLCGADPDLVFKDVPMSRHDTGQKQEARLRDLRLDVIAAPAYRDIDTVEDLLAVAAAIPGSRTFAATRRLVEAAAVAS
jgi:hypothetical protein